jgi:hypothetical protein
MAQGATLENWARGSEWARDTGVDIARATEGKWRELFEEVALRHDSSWKCRRRGEGGWGGGGWGREKLRRDLWPWQVKLDEAMRESLLVDADYGPSMGAQLQAGKKLAEEQLQRVSEENGELGQTCEALRTKLMGLESILRHTDNELGTMKTSVEESAVEAQAARHATDSERVDRSSVAQLLMTWHSHKNAEAKLQALEVLAGVLELGEDARVSLGLTTRWALVEPEVKKEVAAGSTSLSFVDVWATFLSGS